MNRRVYLAAVGSATLTGLAGCTALGDIGEAVLEPSEYDIGMSRNEFLPDEYEATVGETVVWKNTSEADHTITAVERSLPEGASYFSTGDYPDQETATEAWHNHRGGRLGTRDTFEHTFEVPGTYRYICEPHVKGGMVGTVIVTE
ncbi:plastocyanin/azurin family copper-binding protein [Natrialbaceae archaeon A-chndr2]